MRFGWLTGSILCLALGSCRSSFAPAVLPEGLAPVQSRLAALGIEKSIPELRELESLDLMGAPLEDTDLGLIDRLPKLIELDLSQASLSRDGLKHLQASARRLQRLRLSGCAFRPDSLAVFQKFRELKALSLSRCDLSHLSLSELQGLRLRYLDVSYTELRDLDGLADLPALETLILDGLSLESDDVQALTALPRLRRLSLNSSVLPKGAWQILSRMPGLQDLELRNPDKDSAPLTLPRQSSVFFSNLKTLDLSENKGLSRAFLQALLRLPGLQRLFLSDTDLRAGDFPKTGPGSCRLSSVALSGLSVRDPDLDFLLHCRSLRYLDLSRTKVQGAFLRKLPLARLEFLDLSETPFEGRYLRFLTGSPKIRILLLNQTRIGLSDVSFFHRLKRLERLELNDTRSGRAVLVLPDLLPRLRRLSIINNGLSPKEADLFAKKYKKILIEF